MLHIGVLSDTHISECTDLFHRQVNHAFSHCQVIIHAGDLIDRRILQAFSGKEVHAVHGNMCTLEAQTALPPHKIVTYGRFTIGICHGAGNRLTIEDRLLQLFPAVDCIVFGHTHIPRSTKIGNILLLNPGSFQGTGRHGAMGTYAVLTIDEHRLSASLHELPADL
jgi:hypothetical protein